MTRPAHAGDYICGVCRRLFGSVGALLRHQKRKKCDRQISGKLDDEKIMRAYHHDKLQQAKGSQKS